MNILEINNNCNFNDLDLEAPSSLAGGSYFTKFINKNNYKSVYLQLPKCTTKQGIIKNNTKMYTDLMFNSSELQLLKWLEEFEQFCQKKIFDKKEVWFHNDITLNDIQEMMNPLTRNYKSGKYTLLRSQLKNNKIKIYDENENILDLENIKLETIIIPLIHLNGIKFTSNNFTIDINLVQLMIISNDEEISNCIINIKNNKNSTFKNLEENKIKNNSEIQSQNTINNIDINNQIKIEDNNSENNTIEDNNSENNSENNTIEDNTIQDNNSENNNIEDNTLDTNSNNKNIILDTNNKIDNDILKNSINLKEINLDEIKEENDKIDIKDAEMVYYEIYKAARKKAKQIKQSAIEAYLEAKKIKNQYMISDNYDSSESENEELSNI
jgi:hypothetical protein